MHLGFLKCTIMPFSGESICEVKDGSRVESLCRQWTPYLLF